MPAGLSWKWESWKLKVNLRFEIWDLRFEKWGMGNGRSPKAGIESWKQLETWNKITTPFPLTFQSWFTFNGQKFVQRRRPAGTTSPDLVGAARQKTLNFKLFNFKLNSAHAHSLSENRTIAKTIFSLKSVVVGDLDEPLLSNSDLQGAGATSAHATWQRLGQ